MPRKIPVGKGLFAIVDSRDYKSLVNHKWHHKRSEHSIYAYTNINTGRRRKNGKFLYYGMPMHRMILDPPKNSFVDHIDGNGLNNTRKNIRVCTQTQNAKNRHRQKSSKAPYKGISFCKQSKKWRPRISVKGKNISFGLFSCPVAAARAYDEKAIQHHGEFARLNFPK